MSNMICSVDGCDRKHFGKSYCKGHYQRVNRTGKPGGLIKTFIKNKGKICSIEGCEKESYSKGFCRSHARINLLYGDPLFMEKKRKARPKECIIDGCNGKIQGYGYCPKHYHRFKTNGDPLKVQIEQHGMGKTPEYSSWLNMKHRCYYEKHGSFHRYGGRGITVCPEWKNSFLAFYEYMGKKPNPKYELDRIDNGGNYEPGNCQWISHKDNSRKTSATKLNLEQVEEIKKIYSKGNITAKAISEMYNVCDNTVNYILKGKCWA